MDIRRTSRGFEIVEFNDANGVACSLQQSSAIGQYPEAMEKPGSSFVWLGASKQGEPVRMHLDREMVRQLRNLLTSWLGDGRFSGDE